VSDTLDPVTTQGERLLALQRAAGFPTLADFARAAGIEPGTARQQANRHSIPKDAAAKYVNAARGTGASAEWLLFGTGSPPRQAQLMETPTQPAPSRVARMVPEVPPQGRPDIPVWASAQAGDDGALILTPDPIDHIYRSERMRGVKNPFAFYVIGDSMSPAIEHGDQVVVNPAIPPRPNVDCVFIQDTPDGGMLGLVKRLLRIGGDHWRVRQFSAARDFDLSRKKWSRAYVIAEIRRGGL
jgi:phage repressor protein C with HTH and peptisase S24 domain